MLALALATAACGREAASEIEDRPRVTAEPPCDGCTLELPAGTAPVPLLVVLHGNHESAADAARRWHGAARAHGWAVLGLQCPRARGCDDEGRWYRWRGEPGWIFEQVEEVARAREVDAARIYLVGWSGGATYLGQRAPHWHRTFAAVVFHGGGQPPSRDACPARALPAYFLVGDRNPAHPAARRLRAYWEACGQDHVWDLLPGANHAAEEAALDHDKAAEILRWLDRRARAPQVSELAPPAGVRSRR